MAKSRPQSANSTWPLVLILGAAALLLVAGVGLLVSAGSGGLTGGVGPRFSVDREKLDLGKQKFDQSVHAAFQVKNTGDAPLTLDVSAPVQALEGC